MKRADVSDREVVEAARDFRAHERGEPVAGDWLGTLFVDELLVTRTGCPLKVAHAAIERAMMRGLVESGVSRRTCWPTPAGLELLG